jgi:two-component system sensor histidine kinase UhpB
MKRIEDLNILILEDDRIFAEVLSRNLSRVGLDMSKISIYDSIETEDEEFINLKPDVVFLDLNIIGSSGLDTYYAAEPIFPSACFIILSGHNDEQLALQCVEAGAQDYISKSDASAYALLKSIQYGLIRKKQLLKERIYVKAFKHSPFASVITSGKGGDILQTNEAYERLFGKPTNNVAQNVSFLIKENINAGSGDWFISVLNAKGEEKMVKVWAECIDKKEDLYLYKISDKEPVVS